MVILRTRNKITDFFMILAWASPFKIPLMIKVWTMRIFLIGPRYATKLVIFIHWEVGIAAAIHSSTSLYNVTLVLKGRIWYFTK